MGRCPFLPLVLVSLVLSGCVNYEEEFAIGLSGGGHIRSRIEIKADLAEGDGFEMKRGMEEMFTKAKGLSLSHYDCRTSGKLRITEFQIDFDKVDALKAVASGEEGAEMARFFGKFTAEKLPDRYVMTRTIDLSGGLDGQNPMAKKGLARGIASKVLQNYTFVYHMRFPVKVLGANTEEIDAGQNLVTWRIPLTDALKGPVPMRAEVSRPPILAWVLFAGSSVLAVAIPAGWWMRRRRSS
jgi:hypothetical protein